MATKNYDVEYGKKEGIKDDGLSSYIGVQFESAKKTKQTRSSVVDANKAEIEKVQNMVDEADNLVGRTQVYKSPILVSLIERLIGSDWVPSLRFNPEQPNDIHLARNGTRVHDFMLDKGGFRKAMMDAAPDLFIAGRCYLLKGYKNRVVDGTTVPTIVSWKHSRWANTYHTKNGRSWFILDENYTSDRLIEEFGEGIKEYDIIEGNPYSVSDISDKERYINWERQDQKIGVMWFWNPVRKQHAIIIGAGKLIYRKLCGDEYPQAWIDQWGNGFVPIDMFDASAVKIDDFHPISPVDRTMDIWRSYSAMMAATIARAKKAANPREVIGSVDPVESRRIWEQGEVNRMHGVDIPHFEKVDAEAGSGLVVKTMDVGVSNNNVMTWRDAFLEEIMISETVNLRSVFQESNTLGQDQLKKTAEIKRITDLIKINEPNWQRFCETNMLMLVGVESEFMDTNIGIEDEVSDKYPGQLAKGTVGDVMQGAKEFPFNVVVSINNMNQARKEIDIMQSSSALQTMAMVAPGSAGLQKMALELARKQAPNIIFAETDFAPAPAPTAPQGGMPSIPNGVGGDAVTI